MLTYKELSQQYAKHSNTKSAYWLSLQNVIVDLMACFEESLQLSSKTYTDENGKNCHYVEVGTVENDVFVASHPRSLPGNSDLAINFGISLILEISVKTFPKTKVWFKGFVVRHNDFYMLTLKLPEEQQFQIPTNGSFKEIKEAAEALKIAIFEFYSDHQFGMTG